MYIIYIHVYYWLRLKMTDAALAAQAAACHWPLWSTAVELSRLRVCMYILTHIHVHEYIHTYVCICVVIMMVYIYI